MSSAIRFTAASFTLWSMCMHKECGVILHTRSWHDHGVHPKCPCCNVEIHTFEDVKTGGHDWEEIAIRKLLAKGYTMRQIMMHINHSITNRECVEAATTYCVNLKKLEKKAKQTKSRKTYRAMKKKKQNVQNFIKNDVCPSAIFDVSKGYSETDVQQAINYLEQQECGQFGTDDLIIVTYGVE